MSTLFFLLSGCEKQDGPAERAGKELDKAVENIGEKIEEAGDNFRDGPAENAGEKFDDAMEKTGEKFKEVGENIKNAVKNDE